MRLDKISACRLDFSAVTECFVKGIMNLFLKKILVFSVASLFEIFFGNKMEGGRIYAIAQAYGLRAIFKYVAKMRIAVAASYLCSDHKNSSIYLFCNII